MRNAPVVRSLFGAFVVCALWSCGGSKKPLPSDGTEPRGEAPVRVDVTQAFFVGDVLHVSVQLAAKTRLDAEKLHVTLLGLNQGTVVQSAEQRASEVSGEPEIARGESLLFRLNVPSADLSEYQIRVNWGGETLATIPAASTTTIPNALSRARQSADVQRSPERSASDTRGGLIISGSSLEEETIACPSPPCDRQLAIRAELSNNTQAAISEVRLAVGIYFSATGQLPSPKKNLEPLADGEDAVSLEGVHLSPGEKKKLRIAVDRAVPVVPGGAFLPYVRILDFKNG